VAEHDQTSRTEEATPRKLADARRRGQVAVSQDLKTWAVLVASALAVATLLVPAANRLLAALTPFIARPETMTLATDDLPGGVTAIAMAALQAIAPLLGLVVLAALGAGVAQVGWLWAPQRIAPDPGKLSPLKGLARLVSQHALVEFAKGLLKVVLVSAVTVALAWPLLPQILGTADRPLAGAIDLIGRTMVHLVAAAAAVMTVIALGDFVYQRFAFLQQMRMTKQELQDEHKQSDGDPQVKARLKRLRAERARQRMMAAVPKATVVITNPTHYAVALAYDIASMPAPKVVAKGVDQLALRIRAAAEAAGVPVVDNPPLARALYAAAEVDDEIPPEQYQAVAQVIGYVMRLNQHRRVQRG
jgi:flagellar biosynthetic protein FlhB